MTDIFPEPIRSLPSADIPVAGCTAYLSQTDTHQVLFMQFDQDVELPEHSHAAQWGVVLEGRIEMTIGGVNRTFTKGDRPYIPAGVKHSARIHAGYADISFFDQKDRYKAKP
jgi:quercetin dioxygenase-like cupin family protein